MSNNKQSGPNAADKKDFQDLDAEIMDNVPEASDELNEDQQLEDEKDIINNQLDNINELTEQLEQTRQQLEKEKKEYLFLMAEFDNFRKRSIKEKSEIIRNAAEKAMADLLPVVDDFERGIEANRNSSDPEAIKEGMELIYNKLVKYLEKNGVKPIESTGAEFNPDIHEAIAMVPVEDPEQKGRVIDTPAKGYTINDKVLRHAKVAVGQ